MRLITNVLRFSLFLYVGTMAVSTIAPRLASPAFRPAAVPNDLRVTCVSFAAATLAAQKMLARVLERTAPGPAAAAPRRLTPLAAWTLAVFTWMLVTFFFVSFVGDGGYLARSYSEWAAAGFASGVNLNMATRTVADYLA